MEKPSVTPRYVTTTAEALAKMLHGSKYPLSIAPELVALAKASDLVIVYGASDDLMEFDGAIRDEFGVDDRTTYKIDREGPIPDDENVEDHDELRAIFKRQDAAKHFIIAIWDTRGYSWTYETTFPVSVFDVLEGDEKYCQGLVFPLSALDGPVQSQGDAT